MLAQSNRIEGVPSSVSYSSIVRVSSALVLALGTLIGTIQPGLALSEDELYKFCSKYPNNTQCEGYDIPIPLSRRSGEEGACALNMQSVSLADRCKVLVGEESLTVYIEQGEEIAPLDDQRGTEEFTLDLSNIDSLSYREDESVNQDRLVTNTLLFGFLGAALTKPDKISQVEIKFTDTAAAPVDAMTSTDSSRLTAAVDETSDEIAVADTADSAETDSVEAIADAAEPASSGNLVFETGREQGRAMGESLQQFTNIPLRISL